MAKSLPSFVSSNKCALLYAQHYRDSFDFEMAFKCAKEAGDKGRRFRIELVELQKGLKNNDRIKILNELLRNSKIKKERGEYVDFLGRLYRFSEESLRLAFEKLTGIELKYDKFNRNYPEFVSYLNQNDDLRQKIQERKLKEEPSPHTLNIIFREISNKNDGNKREIKKKAFCVSAIFLKLNEWRNKTIIAHGFEGCTADKIKMLLSEVAKEAEEGKKRGEFSEEVYTVIKRATEDVDSFLKLLNRFLKVLSK